MRSVWWLSPTAVTVAVAAVSVSLTAAVGDDRFRELWGSPKSVTGSGLLLLSSGALTLALAAGAVIAVRPVGRLDGRWPALTPSARSVLSKASTVLMTFTVAGYLGFAILIARSGVAWSSLDAAAGYMDGPPIKDVVGTVPGLTTMTQFGMAAVIISAVLLADRFSRAELLKIVVVVGLAVPRAFLFTERLAVLELVVPLAVVACYRLATAGRARRLIQLLPVMAIPATVGIFSVFEYFRSWEFYRGSSESFWRFSAERAAGYYATALNNGYLRLTHLDPPGHVPVDTMSFFWNAPVIDSLRLYDRVAGNVPGRTAPLGDQDYVSLLTNFGNPEFNNSTGYAAPFIDYGIAGGLLYFAIVGVVAGLLYRSFCDGTPFGLLGYPLLFVGLIELPRYVHWAQGRAFPSWVALIVVAVLLSRLVRSTAPDNVDQRPLLSPVGAPVRY